jgi:transcriptional regulator NrdR family protein
MTSSDSPVPEPESAGPDEPRPMAREPQCRIIYRTPDPLTVEDATRMMADTMAVLSFATGTAGVPAERLPSARSLIFGQETGYFLFPSEHYVSRGAASISGGWARKYYPRTPFDICKPTRSCLGCSRTLRSTILVFLAIPTIVARFSRLRARFARDRLEEDYAEALRARLQSDDVLKRLDGQAFAGLLKIQRAITEDGETTIDSDTVPTDLDDYLKFLDEQGIEEDQGFDTGADS